MMNLKAQAYLLTVICTLYFINLIYFFTPVFKSLCKDSNHPPKPRSNQIEGIIGIISFLIVFGLVCFIALKIVISAIVLAALNICLSAYFLIEKGDDPLLKKLEMRQNPNFWVFMSIGIIILAHSDINKISEMIRIYITNGLLSDFVYIIFLLGIIYLHSVMIVPLLLLPVKLSGKWIIRSVEFARRVAKKLDKIIEGVLNKNGTLFVGRLLTSFLMLIIKNDILVKKVLALFGFIPFLLIDFLRNIMKIALLVIYGLIKCIFELAYCFILVFSSFIVRITDIKDRIIISYTVRISTVLSLTMIVVLNRVLKLIINYEDGTAILEFLASAIIIPVLINWIYDAKKEREHSINLFNSAN